MDFQKPSHTTKIHFTALRTNCSNILFFLCFCLAFSTLAFSQDIPKPSLGVLSEKTSDSIPKDSIAIAAKSIKDPTTNEREIDSVATDSIKKDEFLKDVVTYEAEDYVSINQKQQKIYLYNEAKVNYQDMEITAGKIIIDYNTSTVYAGRLKDSSGYYQRPVFTQGDNVIEPDSIIFNTDTKKALVFNAITEQQGFNTKATRTKKVNDSVYYMGKARFTTAEDLDDPEYQFVTSKLKMIPDKKIVVGPTYMEIYGVPTPIALPFAFFPMSKKQTSGIIFPTFGEDLGNDRGYFLQNGGYYFAISDYMDLLTVGDYYSNGSYGLRIESNYRKRYRFNGNVSFRYENLLNSERGFPDFSQQTIYNIRWSHNQDAKANPSARFTASVNLGSSQYFQQSINQNNQANFLNNTLNSSVSFNKTFQGEPQFNLNLTASHSQNTRSQQINLTLPTLQASMSRVFPFAPKTGSKKGAIQNINFQINTRGEYRINTTDSIFGTSAMFDDAVTGMRHSIPVTTNFKVFNYFSASLSANFDENWVLKTTNRFVNTNGEVEQGEVNGFDRFLTYNASASIGTTIYGLFKFKNENNNPKIHAIRHVIRPSLSFSITPAFDQYYETFDVIDADGNTSEQIEFTRFENALFGTPGNRFASNIGLTIGNNFEAKIRERDTTKTEPKKVMLLNNLNISTAYNLAADSLNISPVRISGGTQILDDKMNINFGMTLNPYALNSNNQIINTFNVDNGGSLFRMTSANVNISYSLNNDTFSGKEKDEEKTDEEKAAEAEAARSGGRVDGLFGENQDFADQRLSGGRGQNTSKDEENNEFYNYKMPWNLNLAYVANYSNARRENQISSHSLMFSGDVDLSPRWSIGASSGYDFLNKDFTFTQLRFERDLLSWRMNFTWLPFGPRTSWNFFIGIRSNLLKDLKYDQRRQPDIQLGR